VAVVNPSQGDLLPAPRPPLSLADEAPFAAGRIVIQSFRCRFVYFISGEKAGDSYLAAATSG
jgi:hypothetical protein